MKVDKALGSPATGQLSFLIDAYKPHHFYFEVLDCARRLLLASIVGLIAVNSPANAVAGLLICLFYIYVFLKLEPYNEQTTNDVSVVLSYSLSLLYLAALMIKVDVVTSAPSDQNTYGILLILVLFAGKAFFAIF